MNENMKLWKYSGTFLVITGIIHTVYALLLGKDKRWINKLHR